MYALSATTLRQKGLVASEESQTSTQAPTVTCGQTERPQGAIDDQAFDRREANMAPGQLGRMREIES